MDSKLQRLLNKKWAGRLFVPWDEEVNGQTLALLMHKPFGAPEPTAYAIVTLRPGCLRRTCCGRRINVVEEFRMPGGCRRAISYAGGFADGMRAELPPLPK